MRTNPSPPPEAASPGALATLAATVVGNTFLVVATIVLGLIASVVGWLPPRGHWMYVLCRWWSRGFLAASGVRVESHFEAPLDPRGAYVVLSNHQSMYDVPVIIASLPAEARFLAKKSLFKIPIFGWAMAAAGFVPVDRSDRSRARETFRTANERLESGLSLVIFPEETRSPDGRLLPFKKGGLLMALKSGYPIVPVGIHGTISVRPRGSLRTHPGKVTVRYGRPIDPGDFGIAGRRDLTETVRERIAELAETQAAI